MNCDISAYAHMLIMWRSVLVRNVQHPPFASKESELAQERRQITPAVYSRQRCLLWRLQTENDHLRVRTQITVAQ
jgi:hypothetical protein